MRFFVFLLAVGVVFPAYPVSAQEVDGGACGSLENAYGPFDYRRISGQVLHLVEGHHFSPQVETLQRGQKGYLGGDIDYTLRAIPNHPRALLAMTRLSRVERTDQPRGSRYSVKCWFERAVNFAPDDPMVRVLYGDYLITEGKRNDALAQLNRANDIGSDDANVQYNLGLAFFNLKKYDMAMKHARKAYAAGFPLPGLRNMLISVGKWHDSAPLSARIPN